MCLSYNIDNPRQHPLVILYAHIFVMDFEYD